MYKIVDLIGLRTFDNFSDVAKINMAATRGRWRLRISKCHLSSRNAIRWVWSAVQSVEPWCHLRSLSPSCDIWWFKIRALIWKVRKSDVTPFSETKCPRNLIALAPNSHFSPLDKNFFCNCLPSTWEMRWSKMRSWKMLLLRLQRKLGKMWFSNF